MKDLIQAYNTIHTHAGDVMDDYILSKRYRLRKLGSLKEKATELFFLNKATENTLHKNIFGSNTELFNEGTLINKINLLSVDEVYAVSKHIRPSYESWFKNKKLCTYYENWERLAYKVCEIVKVDVEMVPVVCDMLVEVGSMEIECIREIRDTYAEEVICQHNVDLSYDEVICNKELNIESIVHDCSVRYDIDVKTINDILCQVYPQLSVIDLSCENIANVKLLEADENLECN